MNFIPLFEIIENEVDSLGVESNTFQIVLNNAIWNTDADEEIMNYYESDKDAFNLVCTRQSDTHMEVTLEGSELIGETRSVRFPLFVTVEDIGYATLEIESLESGISGGTLSFAKVVNKSFETEIRRIHDFGYGEIFGTEDFEIWEIAPYSFPTNKSTVTMKLNDGFVWTHLGEIYNPFEGIEEADMVKSIHGDTLTLEIDFSKASDRYGRGSLYMYDQGIMATTDIAQDVSVTVSGANIPKQTVKIAEYEGNKKDSVEGYSKNTLSKTLRVLPDTELIDNVPYLKISEFEIGDFRNGSSDIDLILDNGTWNDEIVDLLNESVKVSHDDFVFEFSKVDSKTVNVKVTESSNNTELRWFSIPLFVSVENLGLVTIEVDSSKWYITDGIYPFAHVLEPCVEAFVEDVNDFYRGEESEIEDIYFEEVVAGSLAYGGESYVLTLEDGFEWSKAGNVQFSQSTFATAETKIIGQDLVIEIDYKEEANGLRQMFTLIGVEIKSTSNSSLGNVKVSIDSLKNAFEDKLTIATCKEASSNTSEGSTTGGNTTGGITTGGSNTGGGGGGGRPQEKTAEEKVNDQIKKENRKTLL